VTDGQTVRRSDGQTVRQTESIIANTALCIARAMLTRCNKMKTYFFTPAYIYMTRHTHHSASVSSF